MSAPTPAQVSYATALGVYHPAMDFDACSEAISVAKVERARHIREMIDEAKRVDIFALIGEGNLSGKGNYRSGPCPFCPDRGEDRFVIDRKGNRWLCRYCTDSRYKSVVDFVMKRDNLRFIEAVLSLTSGDMPKVVLDWTPASAAPWEAPWWLKKLSPRYFAPERFQAWKAYKPLSGATIEKHQLGLGVVPACPCKHERLIVPIFSGGQLVNIRGRRIACDCPQKWMSSARCNDALYGLDDLEPGRTVWICGNNVDRLLLEQVYAKAEYQGLSPTMGEGAHWKAAWIERIAEMAPARVVVAFDNDETGYKSGLRVAAQLTEAGVQATIWEWKPGAPPKADVGWLLMRGGVG